MKCSIRSVVQRVCNRKEQKEKEMRSSWSKLELFALEKITVFFRSLGDAANKDKKLVREINVGGMKYFFLNASSFLARNPFLGLK